MSVIQQNHVFIDPDECGSGVGYYLTMSDYIRDKKTTYSLSGTVVLTDCNHKIDWSFGVGQVDKIDAAISMLQKFKRDYLAMEKMTAKMNGEK